MFVLLADPWAGNVQCVVSITNTGNITLTGVKLYFDKVSDYSTAAVVSCSEGGAPAIDQGANLATGVTRVCIVSLPLTPEEITANAVTLWAGAQNDTAGTPITARTTTLSASTARLTTSFTAADCAPVAAGEDCDACVRAELCQLVLW